MHREAVFEKRRPAGSEKCESKQEENENMGTRGRNRTEG